MIQVGSIVKYKFPGFRRGGQRRRKDDPWFGKDHLLVGRVVSIDTDLEDPVLKITLQEGVCLGEGEKNERWIYQVHIHVDMVELIPATCQGMNPAAMKEASNGS